jgi:hypothetical protein
MDLLTTGACGKFDHPYADWRGPSGGWGNP